MAATSTDRNGAYAPFGQRRNQQSFTVQSGVFSVNSTGQVAVTADAQGLYVMGLHESPFAFHRILHQSRWDVDALECCRHVAFPERIATASHSNVLIWDIAAETAPLLQVLRRHQQPVTSLSWVHGDGNIFASASGGSTPRVCIWDLRMSGTGSSNRPCLEFIGDGDAKLGLSPLGSGMGNTSGIPSTLSAATPIGAGHFGSVFTGASIGGVGSKGGSIWAVVRAAALFTGSLTPTSGGSTPGAGLGQSDAGLRTQLDVQIEWSTLRPQYFSTSASLAFSGDQEHVDAHQASVHVWDIRRTSGNIPTLTLGRGSVSAASCVAEFQCAGPRANCLRWHPTNDRLLGTSSTIVGDSFAQGCIVQVWDITNGDQSRSMSNSESLTQQCGVAVIPTHCSLASSNTGTGNNFGHSSSDLLFHDKITPEFEFTPRGDAVVTASLRLSRNAVPQALHFLSSQAHQGDDMLHVSPAVIAITPIVVADQGVGHSDTNQLGLERAGPNIGPVGIAARRRVQRSNLREAVVRASVELMSRESRRPFEVPMTDFDDEPTNNKSTEEARGGGGGGYESKTSATPSKTASPGDPAQIWPSADALLTTPHLFRSNRRRDFHQLRFHGLSRHAKTLAVEARNQLRQPVVCLEWFCRNKSSQDAPLELAVWESSRCGLAAASHSLRSHLSVWTTSEKMWPDNQIRKTHFEMNGGNTNRSPPPESKPPDFPSPASGSIESLTKSALANVRDLGYGRFSTLQMLERNLHNFVGGEEPVGDVFDESLLKDNLIKSVANPRPETQADALDVEEDDDVFMPGQKRKSHAEKQREQLAKDTSPQTGDTQVPGPALCGAVFSAGGALICFNNEREWQTQFNNELPARKPHDKGQPSKRSARARPRARSRRSVGRERVRQRQPQSLSGSSDDSDAVKGRDEPRTEQVEEGSITTAERSTEGQPLAERHLHNANAKTVGMQASTGQDHGRHIAPASTFARSFADFQLMKHLASQARARARDEQQLRRQQQQQEWARRKQLAHEGPGRSRSNSGVHQRSPDDGYAIASRPRAKQTDKVKFSTALVNRLTAATPLTNPNFMHDHQIGSHGWFRGVVNEEDAQTNAIVALSPSASALDSQSLGRGDEEESPRLDGDDEVAGSLDSQDTFGSRGGSGSGSSSAVRTTWESIAQRTAPQNSSVSGQTTLVPAHGGRLNIQANRSTASSERSHALAGSRAEGNIHGGSSVRLDGSNHNSDEDDDADVNVMFEQERYYSDSGDDWEVLADDPGIDIGQMTSLMDIEAHLDNADSTNAAGGDSTRATIHSHEVDDWTGGDLSDDAMADLQNEVLASPSFSRHAPRPVQRESTAEVVAAAAQLPLSAASTALPLPRAPPGSTSLRQQSRRSNTFNALDSHTIGEGEEKNMDQESEPRGSTAPDEQNAPRSVSGSESDDSFGPMSLQKLVDETHAKRKAGRKKAKNSTKTGRDLKRQDAKGKKSKKKKKKKHRSRESAAGGANDEASETVPGAAEDGSRSTTGSTAAIAATAVPPLLLARPAVPAPLDWSLHDPSPPAGGDASSSQSPNDQNCHARDKQQHLLQQQHLRFSSKGGDHVSTPAPPKLRGVVVVIGGPIQGFCTGHQNLVLQMLPRSFLVSTVGVTNICRLNATVARKLVARAANARCLRQRERLQQERAFNQFRRRRGDSGAGSFDSVRSLGRGNAGNSSEATPPAQFLNASTHSTPLQVSRGPTGLAFSHTQNLSSVGSGHEGMSQWTEAHARIVVSLYSLVIRTVLMNEHCHKRVGGGFGRAPFQSTAERAAYVKRAGHGAGPVVFPFARAALAPICRYLEGRGDMQTLGTIGCLLGLRDGMFSRYRRAFADLLYFAGAIELHHEILKGLSTTIGAADAVARFQWQDTASSAVDLAAQSQTPGRRPGETTGLSDRGRLFTNTPFVAASSDSNISSEISDVVKASRTAGVGCACIVCLEPSRHGMVMTCGTCGHGGHFECMADWFSAESLCPTGCGCQCVERHQSQKLAGAGPAGATTGSSTEAEAPPSNKVLHGNGNRADGSLGGLSASAQRMREKLIRLSTLGTETDFGSSGALGIEADDPLIVATNDDLMDAVAALSSMEAALHESELFYGASSNSLGRSVMGAGSNSNFGDLNPTTGFRSRDGSFSGPFPPLQSSTRQYYPHHRGFFPSPSGGFLMAPPTVNTTSNPNDRGFLDFDEHFSLGASAMRPTQSQGEVPTTHSVHAHRKELETIVQQVSDDELADGLW